jgi:hypothetical protein
MEGLGLLEKFKQQQSSSITSILPTNQGEKDKMMQKLESLKEILKMREDEAYHLEQAKVEFFDYFDKQFSDIYEFKNLTEYLPTLQEMEDEIKNVQKSEENKTGNTTTLLDKKFIKKIEHSFSELKELKLDNKKENNSIETLQNFSKAIQEFYDKMDQQVANDFISKRETLTSSNVKQNSSSCKKVVRKRQKLLSTAFIKKAKSSYASYGEEDLIFSPEKEDDITQYQKDKSVKLKLRNFLQVYLIKENEIFSQSYYSKFDPTVLYSYRNYRYYEIKFCISKTDTLENIEIYMWKIKSMFEKYILTYKDKKERNYIKLNFSGYGRKQYELKNTLIKYINTEIKADCLIKISFFSNLFDCMKSNLKKIKKSQSIEDDEDDEEKNFYYYNTNFDEKELDKVLSKIKIIN